MTRARAILGAIRGVLSLPTVLALAGSVAAVIGLAMVCMPLASLLPGLGALGAGLWLAGAFAHPAGPPR